MSRTITDHRVNGLNEAIRIEAVDQPGPGGANHTYTLDVVVESVQHGFESAPSKVKFLEIKFQNGPIGSAADINGFSNEALLAVLIDRMRGFQHPQIYKDDTKQELVFDFSQRGKYACRENAIALTHLEDAMHCLQSRTRARIARGVEGTHKV